MTASSAPPLPARRRPGLLARAWHGLRVLDAILITLLPLFLLGLLFGLAVRDYSRARQFDDWWSLEQSVAGALSARIHALLRAPTALALRQGFNPEAAHSGVIRLQVEGPAWDSIQSDPQGMWGEWVEGQLEYGGTAIPARLRKRGDNSIHWLTDKRTLTVRTPRDQFYKRFRTFGLSVKDVVPSYLANRLGAEFGILSPATEVVTVYLNNRFYGTYRFIEIPDESFLRPFDRMPGNIFRADRAERGEYYKGVPRNVFDNPYLWDRTAVNDRWTSAGPDQLRLLLEEVQGRSFADHQRLMRRLDPDELARLFAYLFVVGDPYHMDGVHNQLLYEDPSTQQLHPIPWDIRLLDLSRPQPPLNDFFKAVLRDPFLVDRTIREVGMRLADDRILQIADSLLQSVERQHGKYLDYDRARVGLVPDVGSSGASLELLRRNVAQLRSWLADAAVALHSAEVGGVGILDLETRGRVGVDLVALQGTGPPAGPVMLRLDRNRNGIPDPSDPAVPLRTEEGAGGVRLALVTPLPLLAGWDTDGPAITPGHVPYRLFLTGVPGDVRPVLVNRVTRAEVAPEPWEPGSFVRPPTAWHPWQYPWSPGRTTRLQGTIELRQSLRIPEGDTLVIEPGTTLRLAPDVSIVSRGLVLAEGTEARPIRVVPSEEGRPWGTFSLQGHGADGSRLRWIEFARGGGALFDRIEYIGMVNVHRADHVTVDHATFRDNVRSDDTFHALHSTVRLTNSLFVRANSDAVDFDISSGEILNNTFEASGGDALDLMTSTPRIAGNMIRGSGDKGISIGEASHPFVFDNLIENSASGIEVKDRSAPVILNNELVGNGVGLGERRKNWRYGGGGWATIVNTVFRGSRLARERDSLSRLTTAGVVGLDESPEVGKVPDLKWLYRRYGIDPTAAAPGRPAMWRPMPVIAPLEEHRFVDDFGPVADGWTGTGGVTRLEKRRDALLVEVQGRGGSAMRGTDWQLPSGGTLVLEVAGRDLTAARVTAYAGQDSASASFRPDDNRSAFQFVVLPLPPGRYGLVRVEIEPRPGLSHVPARSGFFVVRAGRLEVRSVAIYPTALGGDSVASPAVATP